MRTLDECRAEVFRRSQIKLAAKRARRRRVMLLATATLLIVALLLAALIPAALENAQGKNDGSSGGSSGGTTAPVPDSPPNGDKNYGGGKTEDLISPEDQGDTEGPDEDEQPPEGVDTENPDGGEQPPQDGNVEMDSQLLFARDLMKNITANTVDISENYAQKNSALTDFAIRLFGQSMNDNGNTLISPVSVIYALAMTLDGAEGETREQMEDAIGMSAEELNLYLYSYMASLPDNGRAKLHMANSVWFTDDDGFTVRREFLQTNADYYGADIYEIPFDNNACEDVNRWVRKATNDMIAEILDETSQFAVMYLVNALAFEANWAEQYEEHRVKDGVFTAENGEEESAEFMYGSENYYFADGNAKGFMKRYEGNQYAFVAILPNEGMSLSEYIATLDGESLSALLNHRREAEVKTAIPKFSAEYDAEMSGVLSSMGMTDAFDPDAADFDGIASSEDGNVYIDRVIHKTFIEVGELGTRAGAATGIVMPPGSAPPGQTETVNIYLDRPFVYMLIDTENNIPLFIGTLTSID